MSATIDTLIFVMVFGSYLTRTGTALRIDIRPGQYTEESSSVNVSCVLDGKDADVFDVFMIQITKDAEPPLLTIRHAGLSLGTHVSDSAKFLTEGLITNVAGKSYLSLSILSPSEPDEGRYTCKVFYSDQTGYPKEHRASGNVTIDRLDLHDEVRQLKHQVSALISKAQDDQQTLKDQATRLTSLENKAAFSAALDQDVVAPTGSVIVFPEIILNQGMAYNNATGIFTVPTTGLYSFYVTLRTACVPCWSEVYLKANGRNIAQLRTGDPQYYSQTTVSPLSNLVKGEQVSVVASQGTTFASSRFSVFSGYLINAI